MKKIKRLASLLLAIAMVMVMTLPAMAADNKQHKITVTQNQADATSHTYQAYQVFAGDLATVEGKKVLSNIIWGKNVEGDKLLAALKKDTTIGSSFENCKTAADVAAVLGGSAFKSSSGSTATSTDTVARIVEAKLTGTAAGTGTGKGNVDINVTGSGYYLIKDEDGTVQENGAYSRFMLEVVGDATATVKSDVPHGDKKVYTDNKQTADANNASIGSHVSYEITSQVPNHVGYKYYYFIMNDTLSEGLTFDGESSIEVSVNNQVIDKNEYTVLTGDDAGNNTFRLAFKNIMKYEVGQSISVKYSATVNDKAVVGTAGNPNTWTLQYSNNPGDTFDGNKEDAENKPGFPKDEDNEPMGMTPKEKTLTYVTELDITKYANSVAEDHLLAGAEFTLTGTSKQVVLKDVDYYEASIEGTYYLLLDGTYTETAPTGTQYVEIGVGTSETTTGYIKQDENYVVPTNSEDYNGETLYKLVKGNAATYADVNTKYAKKTATETEYVDTKVSIELTTGADGKISFKDLGAGTYTLTETVTPEGFNTLEPIEIVIGFKAPDKVSDGTEQCTWTMKWDNKDVATGNGIFARDVINKSGSLLPSTGGIGTTIFYVVGAILVIGAGIILVAKKRMSQEQ